MFDPDPDTWRRGYDAWKTREPDDNDREVCGRCGYYIDECTCQEEPNDE